MPINPTIIIITPKTLAPGIKHKIVPMVKNVYVNGLIIPKSPCIYFTPPALVLRLIFF